MIRLKRYLRGPRPQVAGFLLSSLFLWSTAGCGTTKDAGSVQIPVAFAGGPYTANAQSPIIFNAAASQSAPGTTLSSYVWYFGDGATGTGANPTHAYSNAGAYIVGLSVTDSKGFSGTAATSATIVPLPIANAGGPYTGSIGSLFAFNGAGSSAPSGQTITNYAWTFGDGSTGVGVTPTHTYNSAGSYVVSLTVTDTTGGTVTSTASATASANPTPLIVANAAAGVPINPRIYGANNIWYYVPDSSFDAFSNSLKGNAGIHLMRFPGGYESESYNWSNNTLDPTYKNYTATPGVTPAHILSNLGTGNVTFVVRTEDALTANSDSAFQTWANQAAGLVTQYGAQVQDWQIGNEWYNDSGAHSNYAEHITRYGKLLSYFAPAMKAAAAAAGYKINIYASANWISPSDLTAMQQAAGVAAWADVDGIDLHIYTGINPNPARFFLPPPPYLRY